MRENRKGLFRRSSARPAVLARAMAAGGPFLAEQTPRRNRFSQFQDF
ncbi:MAG: hypothetical protein U1E17_15565 [Geminicoccaceae bacterium]